MMEPWKKNGMSEILEKTILITGCRRGIGRDSALALARRGHMVLATTHTQAAAEGLSRAAAAEDLPLESFKLDVTKDADRYRIREHGIDVLINNAALGDSGSLAEVDIDRVRNCFETNLFGPIQLTQIALEQMLDRDSGTVIFISSLAGRITVPFLAPYTMTKFAISSGAETLRKELLRVSDVHVSIVEPGSYHTGFNQEMLAKKYSWMDEKTYFRSIIGRIRSGENRYYRLTEQASTASIVRQIVRAAEAERPKLRYTAPGGRAWVCSC